MSRSQQSNRKESDPPDLRARAEQELGRKAGPPAQLDHARLFHELQVHQVELELQNEELRRAHADLEEAARVYAELYDLAPVAYFTLGPSGAILQTNLAGAYLLGGTRRELTGRSFQTYVIGMMRNEFDDWLRAAFRSGSEEKHSWELILQPRGGRPQVFARFEGVISADGQICRAALLDLTEKRRQEEELRRARVAAEDANRAKSEFLAKMSHEIRTPLNGVLGMMELALLEGQAPRPREYLQLGKDAAKSLLDIINDLLDFSKIEARRLELVPARFDVRHALEAVVTTLAVTASAKGISLRSEIADDVPQLLIGDQGRLRQILTNLIGNAVKFTETGYVEVDVAVEPPSLPASQPPSRTVKLCFTVRDTGIGIAQNDLGTIFESFRQAARPNYGGTGLGLSIARQLVELMGGEIRAESTVGKGSTFRFTALFDLPKAETARSRAARAPDSGLRTAPLRVLVAEDNVVNRVFAEELLHRLGHEVTLVADGRQALQKLEGDSFDVVLMDIEMPVLDGLAATEAIRKGRVKGCPRRLPVVALTAHAIEGDRERFLEAGMSDYLSKPFDQDDLESVLRNVTAEGGGDSSEKVGESKEYGSLAWRPGSLKS